MGSRDPSGSPQPPLIVHVIHHLHMGGMENTLVNLINHNPPGQFRHRIICVEDYDDFRQRIQGDQVEVVALHRSRIGAAALRRRLYTLFRQWRPAIVHSRNMSGLDALLPAFLARVPVRIHSEHGWDVDNLDGSKWKPALLRRLHSPLVSRYITVSNDLSQFLQTRIGVSSKRIQQIYNGVDTERFRPRQLGEARQLPQGFARNDSLCVCTVGRAQAVKDQQCLVQAVHFLLTKRPELRSRLRLVILGQGPQWDALRLLVDELKLSGLSWLPGASDEVPALMRSMDLFVLPSLNEGVSNTILEALASGLPVLATAVGGNSELITAGVNGDLFAARDYKMLARQIAARADDPMLVRRQSQAARATAVTCFSLEKMLLQYYGVYSALAKG